MCRSSVPLCGVKLLSDRMLLRRLFYILKRLFNLHEYTRVNVHIKDMCFQPSVNLSIFLYRDIKSPEDTEFNFGTNLFLFSPTYTDCSLANPPALSRPHTCSGTDAAARCLLNTLSQKNTCKTTPSCTRLHVHTLSHTHISVSYVLSHIRTDLCLLHNSHFPAENVQGEAVTQR